VTSDSRNRWFALILLCMGSLMIVLDTTIVRSPHLAALAGGYRVAFAIDAAFAVLAAGLSARMLRAGAIDGVGERASVPAGEAGGAPSYKPVLADA
jgi:hypothetical protein